MRNGFGISVIPDSGAIFGRFSESSALNVKFWRSAIVSKNSSVLASCCPGQARFPTGSKLYR